MRRLVVVCLATSVIAGCDHFELDARITVRDGQGQLQLGSQADGVARRRYGFFDLAEALEEPAMFEVNIGKQVIELPLRVDGCHDASTLRAGMRSVTRAEVDYELFHAGGKLQLRPIGGSCITPDGATSFTVEPPP